MPPRLRPALIAVALALTALRSAPAQLFEYTCSSDLVGVEGAAPGYLPIGTWVESRFYFDQTAAPTSTSPTSATYAGLYGVAIFNGSETRPIFDIVLTITHDADAPYPQYEYLFSGITPDGWIVVHYAYSTDPSFVPHLGLPTDTPSPDPFAYTAGYIDVVGPERTWWGYSDSGPWFEVNELNPAPGGPMIIEQPQAARVRAGKMAKLEVKAGSGDGSRLSYQWLLDDQPIAGATSRKLKIKHAAGAHEGHYRVLISNSAGQVISEPAFLDIR